MSKNASVATTVIRLAALFTFLAVAMGAVVAATKSGASCPTWPGCRADHLTPQWQLNPVIEFTHRVVAMTAGPLVLAAAVISTRLPWSVRGVRFLPWVALAGVVAAAAFGRLAVLSTIPTWVACIDLFGALIAMTVMGIAAVMVGPAVADARPTAAGQPATRSRVTTRRLAVASVSVLVVMHVTGLIVAGPGSYTACVGWPLWRMISGDLHPWLQVGRLCLAGLGAVLVVATAVTAAGTVRLRGWGFIVAALFAAEMVLGFVISARGLNDGSAVAYSVVAVALLWCLGMLAALAGADGVSADPAQRQPVLSHG